MPDMTATEFNARLFVQSIQANRTVILATLKLAPTYTSFHKTRDMGRLTSVPATFMSAVQLHPALLHLKPTP
eukprot:CAMPEP_0184753934 /NCGR_PEP_ID=MMETSP0315-20130426/44359_1 /TAXON_ID=101924 /ORGANISM="Rhodosorus marinus, Strain UTEX LB 2760" /LENGTH=71 /DNA_ID=CAMNT_0027233333 /DNA_START=2213 /DNA_END=2424 /DNA_ORIENTATION=-